VTTTYDFDRETTRQGTSSVQWDGIADRFGVSDLLPFTISDMDFASPPEVLSALRWGSPPGRSLGEGGTRGVRLYGLAAG
jgi:hypothetical protein